MGSFSSVRRTTDRSMWLLLYLAVFSMFLPYHWCWLNNHDIDDYWKLQIIPGMQMQLTKKVLMRSGIEWMHFLFLIDIAFCSDSLMKQNSFYHWCWLNNHDIDDYWKLQIIPGMQMQLTKKVLMRSGIEWMHFLFLIDIAFCSDSLMKQNSFIYDTWL
jgi:hypothetical protein